jgi:hypothetical protein
LQNPIDLTDDIADNENKEIQEKPRKRRKKSSKDKNIVNGRYIKRKQTKRQEKLKAKQRSKNRDSINNRSRRQSFFHFIETNKKFKHSTYIDEIKRDQGDAVIVLPKIFHL